MSELSTLRLTLLRAMYAFIALGLAVTRWPELLNPPADASHMDNVVATMLGALSLLALLGICYPVRMLPLLLFELAWKAMWVLLFGIPLWQDGPLAPDQQQTLVGCLMGIVPIPLVLPWGYLFRNYVKAPADPWRTGVSAPSPSSMPSTTPTTQP